MENDLTQNEEQLFQLIEAKDYNELTAEERLLVDEQLSESEYNLQRRMISEAAKLFPESTANRLLLPVHPSKTIAVRTVPLYQAIAAVAATIALFLSLWPYQEATSNKPVDQTQLGRIDTVIQTQIITDTIIQYIEHRNQLAVRNTITTDEVADPLIQVKQIRLLEANAIQIPELNATLIHTKGNSLKDDPTSQLLLGNVYQATNW